MDKPRLTYFDIPASRGEECRLALHLAGVEFEDVRVKNTDWAALKPTTPFGSMPILELPGRPPLAQSNAILVYLGRSHGLHPSDLFEAARHEAMMSFVEDARHAIAPTLRMADPEKKKAREALAEGALPAWGERAERQISDDGPFFGGAHIQVVDLKIFLMVKWLAGGKLDYIPPAIWSHHPKLNRVHDAVRDHAGVKAWYARR
jgi:prostaglandin-H2 D-isomerase / glutathione transferase